MANPNINNPTDVRCGSSGVRLVSTSETLVVSNAASSNKVYLIDSIYVTNVHGTNALDITLNLYPNAINSGVATAIVSTVSVPADAVLVPVAKDTTITLLENQSIYAQASAASGLHVIAGWKEIS